MAMELPHDHRPRYFAIADLAEEMATPSPPSGPQYPFEFLPPSECERLPEPEPEPYTIPKYVPIYSKIATAVLARKDANLHRAFIVWSVREKVTHSSVDEVINLLQEKTGKHRRTISRWLDAGEGIFWTISKDGERIYWHRMGRVVDYFGLERPGRKVDIPSYDLLGSLQRMRAALYNCRFNGKEEQWASRSTIEQLTGVEERTQRNYQRYTLNTIKVFTLGRCVLENGQTVDARQLPNKYYSPYECHNKAFHKFDSSRCGLFSTTGDNGMVNSSLENEIRPQRLLFDNSNEASDQAYTRSKKNEIGELFIVVNPTKKSLICKTITYGNL